MIKEKDYVGGKDMSKTVYKLNVQLKGAKPECFRTFIIRSDCKMMTLASTIIAIFNGNASHIYSFDVPAKKLDVQIYIDEGMNDNDDDFAINVRHEQPSKHVDARKYKISDCFEKVGDEAAFLYDFGDGWQFDIRLQEIIEDQVYEKVSPWVLEGSGLGIIEDCGDNETNGLYKGLVRLAKNIRCDADEKVVQDISSYDIQALFYNMPSESFCNLKGIDIISAATKYLENLVNNESKFNTLIVPDETRKIAEKMSYEQLILLFSEFSSYNEILS